MGVEFTKVICPTSEWEAFDFTDVFDEEKINFSEISEIAEVAARALSDRKNQIIINAIAQGYDEVKMKFGSASAALTVDVLIKAKVALDDNSVPSDGRTFIHSAGQLGDLLNTTEVTSSDYNSVKALVNGSVNTFLGFRFICIAKMATGGLPQTSAAVTGFIYHKTAVGYAYGKDVKPCISWIDIKQSWMVGGKFRAGAVVIDDEGIAGILSKKS
jgi:hypothetical protein